MNQKNYVSPECWKDAFNCPNCKVYSTHIWHRVQGRISNAPTSDLDDIYSASRCYHCDHIMLWRDEKIIDPEHTIAPEPDDNLSKDIQRDYDEAASILQKSPRAAAALLRLCIQKLCKELGEPGKNMAMLY